MILEDLSNLNDSVTMSQPVAEGWITWPLKVLSDPKHFMHLWLLCYLAPLKTASSPVWKSSTASTSQCRSSCPQTPWGLLLNSLQLINIGLEGPRTGMVSPMLSRGWSFPMSNWLCSCWYNPRCCDTLEHTSWELFLENALCFYVPAIQAEQLNI